jgi:glutamine amidotransferase
VSSQQAFALFLDCLDKLGYDPASPQGKFPTNVLKDALLKTLELIKNWTRKVASDNDEEEVSMLNFAITDGESIVASRYITSGTQEAASLHFSSGSRFFEYEPGQYRMERKDRNESVVMIASEPLTFERNDWITIPTNTVLAIRDQTVLLYPVSDEYSQVDPTKPRSSHLAASKGLVSPVVVSNDPSSRVPPLLREDRRATPSEQRESLSVF